jgi:hypothetical protein
MSNHKDQRGNSITLDKANRRGLWGRSHELEANGVSRERMKIIVGEDGGIVLVGEFPL